MLEDKEIIASNGVKVTIRCDLLRKMTPEEMKAHRDNFNRVSAQILYNSMRRKMEREAAIAPAGCD